MCFFFEDENEKKQFIDYAESHIDLIKNSLSSDIDRYDYIDVDSLEKEIIVNRLKLAKALKKVQINVNEDEWGTNERS